MTYAGLSGLDKAAILFQVLGDGLAVSIFKDLNDTDLRKVRVRARELTNVPFLAKKTVLEEYYFGFLAEKARESEKDSQRPFAFIENLTDEQVAYLLLAEPARIQGIVLAQLSPERQFDIYEKLDPTERIDALASLGDASGMNLEAIVSVASDLQEKARYLPKASEFERGSGEKLAGMLNRMGMEQAELFLDKLSKENPELLKEVKRYYLTFSDLIAIPDENILFDVLNECELDDLPLAFKGIEDETVDRMIGLLPEKKQAMYEPLERSVSKREVFDARRRMMEVVKKMQDDGRFNLADLLSGDVV